MPMLLMRPSPTAPQHRARAARPLSRQMRPWMNELSRYGGKVKVKGSVHDMRDAEQ